MAGPNPRGRAPEQIVSEESYLDSIGYFYRAASWLDYFRRIDHFPALLYSCIEARYGIEYLLFEELVISTGARLSREQYENALKSRRNLRKLIRQLAPDQEKMQQFTKIVISLQPQAPRLVYWNAKELERSWGTLSSHLHWFGSKNETTEVAVWRAGALREVEAVVDSTWHKAMSGHVGLLHPLDMQPNVREVWEDFRAGRINAESVRVRLELIRPLNVVKMRRDA